MNVRELRYEDYEAASRVLWKSFYEAEKNHTSVSGMEVFRDLTSPVSLSVNVFEGAVKLFGAFDEKLVAVGGIKGEGHILLLYVLPENAKKGIGTALLAYMEKRCTAEILTVNSATSAVPFYEKNGYRVIGWERKENEMIFVPMKKEKNPQNP